MTEHNCKAEKAETKTQAKRLFSVQEAVESVVLLQKISDSNWTIAREIGEREKVRFAENLLKVAPELLEAAKAAQVRLFMLDGMNEEYVKLEAVIAKTEV